jgi:hypothetical protein
MSETIQVSMFANAYATQPKPVQLLALLREIKDGRWQRRQDVIRAKREKKLRETGGDLKAAKKEIKLLKEALPGVTFAGTFSYRENEKWTFPSGFLAADLDHVDSNVTIVRGKLEQSPHAYFVCESVTGTGLRVVFRIAIGTKPDEDTYLRCFEAARQHVRRLCGIEIDPACKDPARLSFVSADRDAYLNLEATPIAPLPETPKAKTRTKPQEQHRDKPDRSQIREMLAVIPKRPDYGDWIKVVAAVGDALSDADAIEVLDEWSAEESPGEYADKLRHRLGDVHIGTLIHLAQEYGWQPPKRNRIAAGKVLPPPPPPYVAPPLDLFPDTVQRFIRAGAATFDVDRAFFVSPILSGAAATIGNARSIRVKEDYIEPPIINTANIAPTGDGKSPVLQTATAPLRLRERELIRKNKEAYAQFAQDLAKWEAKSKKDRADEEKPQKPPLLTCLMDDATIEAVAYRLNDNPHGIALVKDELSHWFESFDQYHDHGGADVSRWLMLWMGSLFAMDRVTKGRSYRIPDPRLSITGGVVPEVFKRLLTDDYFQRGLPARFLFAMPPRNRPRKWIDKDIPAELKADVHELFAKLAALQPHKTEEGQCPALLGLSAEAKKIFVDFHDECARRAFEADFREAAQWSKLSAYSARLALVGQLMRDPDAEKITGDVMQAACDLARWFGHEAERIYALIVETPEQRDQRRLIEFITSRGGAVMVRDLMQSFRTLKNNRVGAETALNKLASAGLGEWIPIQHVGAGRPARKFELKTPRPSTQLSEFTREN